MPTDNRPLLWDDPRRALHAQLEEVSNKLAGVYRRAIFLLDEVTPIGEELVRIALVGHCMRELMNRLPDVLNDVPGMLRPEGPDSSSLRSKLLESLDAAEEPSTSGTVVSVNVEIIESLQLFAAAVRAETARAEEKDSVSVTQTRATKPWAVREWRAAREFFVELTHIDSRVSDDADAKRLPSDAEVQRHLVIVEAVLRSRLSGFFQSRREIDQRLASINELIPDAPTAEEVREILASLGPTQLRRAFFEGLMNPLWVSELARQGAFATPPEPLRDEQGYVRDPPWPEIEYLVRMAEAVPEEVVNVGVGLVKSENAWVRRSLVEIAAVVPADQSARLARAIISWAPDGLGVRTDPRHLASIAEKLLLGGQTRLGVSFANALYHPRAATQTGRLRPEPRIGIESYWYEESLPRVVAALGETRLTRILPWLEDFQIHSGSVAEGMDLSSLGRPRIESHTDRGGDIEHALIDAVRDAAVESMNSNPPETITRLHRSGQTLSKKISLHAASVALKQTHKVGGDTSAIVDAVAGFPSLVEFTRDEYVPEFPEFLQALAMCAGVESLAELPIHAGPLGSRDELVERLRVEEQTAEQLETEADEYIARWQHRLLAAIGIDSLPEGFATLLESLNETLGVLDDPMGPGFEIVNWAGMSSLLESGDFAAMSADELLSHLESWHPDPVEWRGPSHEGQARVLSAFLTENPMLFGGESDRILSLRPVYLRAVIRGWEEARKAHRDIPWPLVVEVLARISELGEDAPFDREGRDYDDDTGYSHVKSAALSLIDPLLSKREGDPRSPTEIVSAVAPILIAMADDPVLRAEYESGQGSDLDPLTLSLNRRLPSAIRGLIKLTAWDGFGGADGRAVVALERHLPTDDPHGAIAAVFGDGLSRLYVHALPWLKAHAATIFGSRDELNRPQEIALSTALATQNWHSKLLEILREPITGLLERGETLVVGWGGMRAPDQLVGDWIVNTRNTGGIKLDDPLVALFFAKANAEVRGDVLGHVGWTLMHATVVGEEVRTRVENLWDARVAHVRDHPEDAQELKDFYWYVRSGKFPVEWWLPRLLEAAELAKPLSTRGMIGEQIAEASTRLPSLALDVVSTLLASDDDDQLDGYDLLERAVPQTLASALDSGDAELAAKASRLMDTLGTRGYIDLESRVLALRARDA